MELRPLAFLLISLMALFASFAYSFMNPFPTFFEGIPLSLLIIGFFFFGAMAFGYLSFVPHLFLGLSMGAERNAAVFLYVLPVMLATYAGALLGSALEKDFNKKKYFLEEGKTVLVLLAIAIILAVAVDIALPYMIEYWPQDWMGMNIKPSEGIWGLISGLPNASR